MGRRASVSATHPVMRDMDRHLRVARYKTEEGYLKPNKKHMPDIFVRPECVGKAIKAANGFFTALAKQDYQVELKEWREIGFRSPTYDIFEDDSIIRNHRDIWTPWKATYVEVNGVGYSVMLYEMMADEKATYIDGTYYRDSELTPALIKKSKYHYTWTSTKHFATGRLCLLIHSYDNWFRKWKEVDGQSLESQVPSIIQVLVDSAPELLEVKERLRLEKEQRERDWEEEKRINAIKREEELVAKATNKSKDDLQGIISIWHEAVKLHDFFASIERQIASATDHRKEHLLERARIAKELAGAIDPLSHLAIWKTPDEVAVLMRKKRRETYWHDDYDDLDEISQGD